MRSPSTSRLPLRLAGLLALTLSASACPQPKDGDGAKGSTPGEDKQPKAELAPEDDAAKASAGAAETAGADGAAAPPDTATLEVDREASKVGFAVARATIGHIGRFDDYSATLKIVDGAPTGLEISVETGSVVADRKGLTSHLKSADFFHVDKFPTATFTADSFTPQPDEGESAYEVSGTMRLHGVERKLKFPATIELSPERAVGTASLDISAKAFGIDYEGMEAELAEDAVSLQIELVFPRVVGG